MTMPRFLYRFGYASPAEQASNLQYGSDFESSAAVLIEASDASEALRWGQEISGAFVTWLFENAGAAAPNWISGRFANWIEPEGTDAWLECANAPVIRVGAMPSFQDLL